jgi:hypothetical protein
MVSPSRSERGGEKPHEKRAAFGRGWSWGRGWTRRKVEWEWRRWGPRCAGKRDEGHVEGGRVVVELRKREFDSQVGER